MGVAVFNLSRIREDGIDTKMVNALNNQPFLYYEQDCINGLCQDRIKMLSSDYNQSQFTRPTPSPKIMHYAYTPGWQKIDLVRQYASIPWGEVERAHESRMERFA